MNRSTLDLWVGLFVAVGVVSLLFLALKVGNLSSASTGETYRLEAKFDNIGGLKVRAPVKTAGVVIGRVSEIRIDPEEYRAVVVMQIDARYQFSEDTSASILTSGLLGEQYIGFNVGGAEAMLKNGGEIKKTQSAVVIENLISQFLYSKAADDSRTGKQGQ
jgi:phospholipid/cholesterol/gamma-HCH transport system substrate-binding protein